MSRDPAHDPILLDAEKRRREKARARGAPAEAPPRLPRVRGPHTATPGSDAKPAAPLALTPAGDTHRDEPSEDDGYPRVPPGIYDLAFQRAERVELWGRARFVCRFTIMDAGPHQGVTLPLYLILPKNPGEKPKRAWALTAAYMAATGRPPPRDLARRNPTSYLGGRVFVGRVADVERNHVGADVPERARYSKVKALLRPAAGRGES